MDFLFFYPKFLFTQNILRYHLLVSISSFLSFILSIVLLVFVLRKEKTDKLIKILVLALFITIIGTNLFNFMDFYYGFINGFTDNF